MDVSSLDADLFSAAVILVRMLGAPNERKTLAPLIIREIIYRLLAGGQGVRLSRLFNTGANTRRILRATGGMTSRSKSKM